MAKNENVEFAKWMYEQQVLDYQDLVSVDGDKITVKSKVNPDQSWTGTVTTTANGGMPMVRVPMVSTKGNEYEIRIVYPGMYNTKTGEKREDIYPTEALPTYLLAFVGKNGHYRVFMPKKGDLTRDFYRAVDGAHTGVAGIQKFKPQARRRFTKQNADGSISSWLGNTSAFFGHLLVCFGVGLRVAVNSK